MMQKFMSQATVPEQDIPHTDFHAVTAHCKHTHFSGSIICYNSHMPMHHLWYDPVILVLLVASVASWVMIFERVLTVVLSARADRAFTPDSPIDSSPLATCYAERQRYAGAGREHLATLLDAAILTQRQRLEGSLAVLGVIGSTAPYVGLLGTVIGIIRAFQAISTANNMSPSVVSSGIAMALVATAAGLAVAIPAVAAHHLLKAAIARRVAAWETIIATWLPDATEGKNT